VEIALVTPAPANSRKGNRITALRWARLLRSLGHCVHVEQRYRGRDCDLLIALHARRSSPSIDRYSQRHPGRPLVVALTGTDLYHDLGRSPEAHRALERANRLVVLQPLAVRSLPGPAQARARVIYQSVSLPAGIRRSAQASAGERFPVCLLGHLRPVKDPFRAAMAVRRLPAASQIEILQVGEALSGSMAERAEREAARNPRYRWLGELPWAAALRTLAGCRLLALTSKMEGGANAISEAVVLGVPVVASRIDGSVGLLGEEYPGYFPTGDTRALRQLLRRAETDAAYYRALREACEGLRPLFDPARERQAWEALLAELA
jgi:putative glycosyltransferase (TIGR04348 family)